MGAVSSSSKSSMTLRQYLVVFGAMLCSLADGYDLSVISFALPHLPDGFASTEVKGWLISAGLVGIGIGAVFVAPLADRWGRRPILLASVALNMVAMVATALAPNVEMMFGTRLLTGVAVGTIATLATLIAQEYAPPAKKNLATGFVMIGFPIGTIGGGVIGLSVVNAAGGAWQAFFWAGAVLTAVILVYTALLVPESLSFLEAQGTPESKIKIGRIVNQLGLSQNDLYAETQANAEVPGQAPNVSLLGKTFRKRSLLLWFGYSFLTAAYFFVASWTPQLIADATGSADTGTTVGTLISVGGLAGGIVFGVIGIRLAASHLGWIFLAVAFVSQIYFALSMQGAGAMIAAGVLGLAAYGAMTSYISAAPQLYPVQVRARGLGTMYGLSRFGSIVAPIVAGYAITLVSSQTMYLAASLLFGISCVIAFVLWRATRLDAVYESAPVAETTEASA